MLKKRLRERVLPKLDPRRKERFNFSLAERAERESIRKKEMNLPLIIIANLALWMAAFIVIVFWL